MAPHRTYAERPCAGSARSSGLFAPADGRQDSRLLAHGSSTYAQDDDPELVREALPFGLKTLEGLSTDLPRHRPLLRSLASGFTSYAVAYVVPESERLESIDVVASRAERDRACRLLLRGRDYGLRALEVQHPSFGTAVRANAAGALARRSTIAGPSGRAAWDRPSPSARAMGWWPTSIVEQLIAGPKRWTTPGRRLDPRVPHHVREPGRRDGREPRARQHYERAMALNHGHRVGPLVALAEQVALREQNRESSTLLARVLAFDVREAPASRLANILAQRRARRLQQAADDLFLKEQP
jgi:hypothetical protein